MIEVLVPANGSRAAGIRASAATICSERAYSDRTSGEHRPGVGERCRRAARFQRVAPPGRWNGPSRPRRRSRRRPCACSTAFTSGGAQRRGGSRAVDFEAATDFDYVRGLHSMRAGVLARGRTLPLGRLRELLRHLYVRQPRGLRSRPSVQLHAAHRRPGRAVHEPAGRDLLAGRLALSQVAAAQLRAALRSADADLPNRQNFSPRATLTWSPLKSGRTKFRGGAGWFNDWLGLGHVRTDAAGGRLQAAGNEHTRSVLSGSRRGGHALAEQPISTCPRARPCRRRSAPTQASIRR